MAGVFWVGGAGRESLRVREVADPKCRCAGEGRTRWILESPRGALPDPHQDLAGLSGRGVLGAGEELAVDRTELLRLRHRMALRRFLPPARLRR